MGGLHLFAARNSGFQVRRYWNGTDVITPEQPRGLRLACNPRAYRAEVSVTAAAGRRRHLRLPRAVAPRIWAGPAAARPGP
ncbi:hypothetical protein LT493_00855 [Streptomyces tricolor]|nr:hypothetical protein [Streptomyces tricolor]